MNKKVRKLIDKFLNGHLSQKEALLLKQWMQQPENRDILKGEIQLDHRINVLLNTYDVDKAYIENKAKRYKASRKSTYLPLLKYAAVFLALVGAAMLMKTLLSEDKGTLVLPETQITLELEDGSLMNINSGEIREIQTQNGETVSTQKEDILYYKTGEVDDVLNYNTLNVPYGKTFKVQLSDGSFVHLNAGTQLKYPKQFPGSERRVYLEGEAYFEVTHDEDRPFIVETSSSTTQVLGTSFNVSAYVDDQWSATVLVEGSVIVSEVDSTKASVKLSPGHMALWDSVTKKINVLEVETTEYTSWMEGDLVFESRTFEDMLRVLERKYNVKIENHYSELNSGRYRARFKDETIEQVMKTFVESRLFSYTIEDNTIIIDKPN